MEVSFNPYFCAKPEIKSNNAERPAVDMTQKADAVELSTQQEEKKIKKHPFRNFIANVAKFFATTTEMVSGTFKGVGYGAATGGSILGVSWLFGALPKGFRKGGSLKEVCKNPIKSISTKSKVIAGIAAVGVLAAHIVVAKLNANQKTANIDHQLKVGHREV